MTVEDAKAAYASGRCDAVMFGRLLIANPDLGRRIREDLPLAEPDESTFYGGGSEGYTDYPRYAEA
jgi:N-ethylmaleimide reductase